MFQTAHSSIGEQCSLRSLRLPSGRRHPQCFPIMFKACICGCFCKKNWCWDDVIFFGRKQLFAYLEPGKSKSWQSWMTQIYFQRLSFWWLELGSLCTRSRKLGLVYNMSVPVRGLTILATEDPVFYTLVLWVHPHTCPASRLPLHWYPWPGLKRPRSQITCHHVWFIPDVDPLSYVTLLETLCFQAGASLLSGSSSCP